MWAGWYFAITIAMLYVANTARQVSTQRIVRLLGWMFVVTTGFGVLAVLAPTLEFQSPMELVLPKQLVSTQLRPHARPPFTGLRQRLPGVRSSHARPHRSPTRTPGATTSRSTCRSSSWRGSAATAGGAGRSARSILVAAIFPITFSLNRGLWISLALAAVYAAVRLAVNGRGRALQLLVAAVVIGGIVFVSSPLYDTLVLRVETPHSNDRRAGTAETVVSVAAEGSPFVGYGTTRTMQGSFSSLAGGETASCHQCAAPPLGTQGFMWRLVLTTGFGGTVLCLSFFGVPVPPPGAEARIRCTSRGARSCWSRCSASSSTTPSGRRCSPHSSPIGLMARSDEPSEEPEIEPTSASESEVTADVRIR